MFAHQCLSKPGIAALQRLDNVDVIDYRSVRPIAVANSAGTDRPHMNKQVVGHLFDEDAFSKRQDRLMKGDVLVGILIEMRTRRIPVFFLKHNA